MQMMPAKDLLGTFILDAFEVLDRFDGTVQALKNRIDTKTLKDLGMIGHRLHGTAALYGYPQTAKLATLVEEIAERFSTNIATLTPEREQRLHQFLELAALCLHGAVERISENGTEGAVGLKLTQLGGSKLLMGLVQASPESFRREKRTELSEIAITQEASLETQLRNFYKDQADVWEFFAPEAFEHIEALETSLSDIQSSGVNEDHLRTLFRATHTLKGAAYMVDLAPLGDLAHNLEDLMVSVRESELTFDERVRTTLVSGTKALRDMLLWAEGQTPQLQETLTTFYNEHAELLGQSAEVTTAEAGTEETTGLAYVLRQFALEQAEIWSYFAPEVREHLTSLATALPEDGSKLSDEALDVIFRATHTLKGAASMVGLTPMTELADGLQELATAAQEDEQIDQEGLVPAFQAGKLALQNMLLAAEAQEHSLDEALEKAKQALSSFFPSESSGVSEFSEDQVGPAVRESNATIRVSLKKLDSLINLVGELVITNARLNHELGVFRNLNGLLDSSRQRLTRTVTEFETKYLNPRLSATGQVAAPEEKVSSLDVSLDELFGELELDSYSDLNILARSVTEMTADLSEVQLQLRQFDRNFHEEVEHVQKLTRDLRYEVSRARMVPVGQLYKRLRRLLGQEVEGKSFGLITSGEAVEIDTAILEAITDPMLHLVKNSLHHGIETEQERTSLGKPAKGQIGLHAYLQGNAVVIEVKDDGRGIDVDKVKMAAVNLGIRSKQEVEALSYKEALNLMFIPGLSTAETVTIDAGRGVGMDVVAANIRQLNGEINITSHPGEGALFTLRLPLTLLVAEALMVEVAGQIVALPLHSIRALKTVPHAEVIRLQQGSFIEYEEVLVPFHTLAELFGLPSENLTDTLSYLILETGESLIALAVDKLGTIEEVVIKTLGEFLANLSYLSGATVSSQGEAILLLNVAALETLVAGELSTPTDAPVSMNVQEKSQTRLLLADDSISVRRVVSKMLERAGYDVTTAADGQEALDLILAGGRFDAVLTDLEMPRLNGYELLEALRRRSLEQDLPIFVMTTRAGAKHRDLAAELGATSYFTKPIDETKLLGALSEALARSEGSQERKLS